MGLDFYKEFYPTIKESIRNTLHAFWLKLSSSAELKEEERGRGSNAEDGASGGQ